MAKLIITNLEVDARKLGGRTEKVLYKDWSAGIVDEIPKSINVSINIELTTTGDFSQYWDSLPELKKEVFQKVFGQFIVDKKFEIEI